LVHLDTPTHTLLQLIDLYGTRYGILSILD